MKYIELDDGSKIEKRFFEQRLEELRGECWYFKKNTELLMDHVLCELTFETISALDSNGFYQSSIGSIVSHNTYNKYIKDYGRIIE